MISYDTMLDPMDLTAADHVYETIVLCTRNLRAIMIYRIDSGFVGINFVCDRFNRDLFERSMNRHVLIRTTKQTGTAEWITIEITVSKYLYALAHPL